MDWTPARIRLLRVGLCLSQHEFARAVGFAKRTVGNAERGVHPPSLSLRRALDQALENASALQRDRFFTGLAADHADASVVRCPSTRVSFERRPHGPAGEQAVATVRRAVAGLRLASGPAKPGSTPSLDQRVLDAWTIRRQLPPQRPTLVLVAGFAGSGKTEFGTFLSALTGWSLLDKDVVTRPLTEALLVSSGGDPHDRHTAVYREKVRPLEYRSLMAATLHNVDRDVSTIVAAPFLEEVSDRDWIARVANRCTAHGTDFAVVWVSCDSVSMHEYLATRGAARDGWKLACWDDYLTSIDLDLVPCCQHAVVDNRNNAATSLADQARELATRL